MRHYKRAGHYAASKIQAAIRAALNKNIETKTGLQTSNDGTEITHNNFVLLGNKKAVDSHTHVHTHAHTARTRFTRTHARGSHARTHARTHAATHTHLPGRVKLLCIEPHAHLGNCPTPRNSDANRLVGCHGPFRLPLLHYGQIIFRSRQTAFEFRILCGCKPPHGHRGRCQTQNATGPR